MGIHLSSKGPLPPIIESIFADDDSADDDNVKIGLPHANHPLRDVWQYEVGLVVDTGQDTATGALGQQAAGGQGGGGGGCGDGGGCCGGGGGDIVGDGGGCGFINET